MMWVMASLEPLVQKYEEKDVFMALLPTTGCGRRLSLKGELCRGGKHSMLLHTSMVRPGKIPPLVIEKKPVTTML